MLLDFHLAQAPIQPGGPVPEFLGGTPGYMAAEQYDAMQAIKLGKPLAVAVDQRADVYALGAVLYAALGGKLPHPAGTCPPLSRINPHVSQGLSDIVAKCMAQRPQDRYATATDLATDLRCHLTNQPLQGVRNRSWSERFQKWQRRSPNPLRNWTILLLLVGTMGMVAYGAFSHWKKLSDDVAFALTDGRKNWRERKRYPEAIAQLKQGLELARRLPLQGTQELDFMEEIRQAELAQAQDQRQRMLGQLHTLAEKVRGVFDIEHLPRNRLGSLNQSCQEFWEKRQLLKVWADKADSDETAHDLLDLVLFATDLQVRAAPSNENIEARQNALKTLHEAESLFGPSVALDEARKQHCQALNLPVIPANAAALQPRTMWEHFTLGRAALLARDPSAAAKHLDRALELKPHAFWPNYYKGQCDYQLRRYTESVAALSVCIGAAPDVAGSYFHRALAFTALKKPDLALQDYTKVLNLDPDCACAFENRGMLHFHAERYAAAAADLDQATTLGSPSAAQKLREVYEVRKRTKNETMR